MPHSRNDQKSCKVLLLLVLQSIHTVQPSRWSTFSPKLPTNTTWRYGRRSKLTRYLAKLVYSTDATETHDLSSMRTFAWSRIASTSGNRRTPRNMQHDAPLSHSSASSSTTSAVGYRYSSPTKTVFARGCANSLNRPVVRFQSREIDTYVRLHETGGQRWLNSTNRPTLSRQPTDQPDQINHLYVQHLWIKAALGRDPCSPIPLTLTMEQPFDPTTTVSCSIPHTVNEMVDSLWKYAAEHDQTIYEEVSRSTLGEWDVQFYLLKTTSGL